MWSLFLITALAASPDFTVTSSTGSSAVGRLVELSPERVAIETAAGRREFPASQVIEMRPSVAPAAAAAAKPASLLELFDGSLLAASSFLVSGDTAQVGVNSSTLKVPTRAIAQVRFQEQSAKIAEQWSDIVKAERTGDVIVIRKQESIDYLAGVLGDVTADNVQFTLDGEQVPVKRPRVEGLLYAKPPGKTLPESFCSVVDATGSRLQVLRTAIEGEELRLTTPAGIEVAVPLGQIVAVQFQVQYLSDLTPESVAWTPFVGDASAETGSARAFHQPRFNRGLEPGKLMLAGKPYAKGLALGSRSEVVFRLPGKFSTLQALAGIDDAARPDGNVRLVIYGDDRLLVEADLTGQDAPRPISVDLKGVNRVKIVVDFNGDEVSDRLNLCDARILK